jgi:hypothetical protein
LPDEVWKLTDEAKEYCRLQGYTEEDIEKMEANRKERYEAIREVRMNGLSEEDFQNYYRDRFELDHECHCPEDEFRGDLLMLMRCQAETYVKMRAKLPEVMEERDILREQLDQLRIQVAELGGVPRV